MDLNNFINNDSSINVELRRGSIIIASPLMREECFARGVISLIDVDAGNGCLGLVLNKPLNICMGSFFDGWKALENVPVYSGGPVDGHRLFMLHRLEGIIGGSMEIVNGLYISHSLSDAFKYLEMGGELKGKLRFFLGYSGWTSGQLEKEILDQAWAVSNDSSSKNLLVGDGDIFWRREVKSLGEDFRPWLLMPENPEEN